MRVLRILIGLVSALALLSGASPVFAAQPSAPGGKSDCWSMARLKYSGGGDWYAGPSALPNLLARVRQDLGADICPEGAAVSLLDAELHSYPILYMTGHGNVAFTAEERRALREYLLRGGLLIADDNYGMDASFRREIRELFPNHALNELPNSHPVFSAHYSFPRGLPKVHEHDGKPSQAFGIQVGGRTVLFYSYECDLTNGWEDPGVHGVPHALREQALRMGVNLIAWFLQGQPSRTAAR